MPLRNDLSDWRNPEYLDNQEDYDLGVAGRAKQVILVDTDGNPLIPPSASDEISVGTTTVPTAGTAVRFNSGNSIPCKRVWVCADLIAGFVVTVGDSSVVGNASGMKGLVLTPGNPPIPINVSDVNLLYADSQSNGGKVSWFIEK